MNNTNGTPKLVAHTQKLRDAAKIARATARPYVVVNYAEDGTHTHTFGSLDTARAYFEHLVGNTVEQMAEAKWHYPIGLNGKEIPAPDFDLAKHIENHGGWGAVDGWGRAVSIINRDHNRYL